VAEQCATHNPVTLDTPPFRRLYLCICGRVHNDHPPIPFSNKSIDTDSPRFSFADTVKRTRQSRVRHCLDPLNRGFRIPIIDYGIRAMLRDELKVPRRTNGDDLEPCELG
jgi:hypothetical protein